MLSSPARAQLKPLKNAFLATMRRCTITICLSPRDLVLRGSAEDKTFVETALPNKANRRHYVCKRPHSGQSDAHAYDLEVRIPEISESREWTMCEYASLLPIPLTTFQQPCAEIGAVSMSAMLERVRNRATPAQDHPTEWHPVDHSSWC